MTQDFTLDPDAVDGARERFASLGDELEQMRWALLRQASDVDQACGEFRSSVEDATDAFHLSWREAVRVCATSSELVSRNVVVFVHEVQLLDGDLTRTIDLEGR